MFKTIRYGAGCSLAVAGAAGIPDDLQSWSEAIAALDSWAVRAALGLLGIIILTYPQWARAIRHRLDIPDSDGLLAGLAFWWGWKRAEWQERRRRKRED